MWYVSSDIIIFESHCILESSTLYGKVSHTSPNFFIPLRYGILTCTLFDNDRKKSVLGGKKTLKNLLPFIKTKALAKFKLKTSAGQLSVATVYPLPTEVDNQIWQYTSSKFHN